MASGRAVSSILLRIDVSRLARTDLTKGGRRIVAPLNSDTRSEPRGALRAPHGCFQGVAPANHGPASARRPPASRAAPGRAAIPACGRAIPINGRPARSDEARPRGEKALRREAPRLRGLQHPGFRKVCGLPRIPMALRLIVVGRSWDRVPPTLAIAA
jgi:hypothetical protein